jgi:hypothetical protein
MEPRECFPLGRGVTLLRPTAAPASEHRPFGMRCAVMIAAAIEDDLSDFRYDLDKQVAVLANPSGDPEADMLAVMRKTTTTRATDADGAKPSTPKDFNTDQD